VVVIHENGFALVLFCACFSHLLNPLVTHHVLVVAIHLRYAYRLRFSHLANLELLFCAAIDSVWTHGIPFGSGFKCHYCNRAFSGGGATRFKEHLAGIIGNVEACQKVPKDVRKCMEESRTEGKRARAVNKARKKRIDDEIARSVGVEDVVTINDYGDDIPNDEEGQLQFVLKRSIHETNIRNVATCSSSGGGSQRRIDTMFQKQSASKRRVGFDIDLACSRAPVQPRINVALNPDLKDKLGRAWSKFFHANSVAGRKANCPYFRAAFKLTQQLGEGVPCPTGESIDGSYLEVHNELSHVAYCSHVCF